MSEYIVFVPLPAEAPIPAEGLDAKLIEADQYEIIGVPFVAYDIHKGDVVRAALEDDALVYQRHVRAGGHGTVRVLFDEDADFMTKTRALMDLKSLGLTAQDPKGRYYALDLPPDRSLDDVAQLLETLETDGVAESELLPPK